MTKNVKILLIEDDDVKRQSVLSAIKAAASNSTVSTAHSVRSAIDSLSKNDFDLVVADMSLPTFDIEIRERGGTPRPFGGIEVFEHLDRISSHIPVLVVTSYPLFTDGRKSLSVKDLQEQLRNDFPSNFAGIVFYDSAYRDWEIEIGRFLTEKFKGQ